MGHLHLDHAGGLEHFKNTGVPVYVHEEEFKHACWAAGTNSDAGLYLWVASNNSENPFDTFGKLTCIYVGAITSS